MARNEPSDAVVMTVQQLVVSDRPCIISGVVLSPAAASCSVILYDNATASTSVKLVVTGAAADSSSVYHSDGGIVFSNGCVAVCAGTGAQATIIYAKI
jgi:hypothetical protein